MRRIKRIEQILRSLENGQGISAAELAEKLGLSRANASSDLNRLCDEGIAIKSGTKPVYYTLSESQRNFHEDTFDRFLHKNASLFQCGELAKAAVLYPPHGMHILLCGETGVGKNMFAELIFNYAVTEQRIPENASFVSFNCADYANNSQLLISQLFGVSKGAYTGADTDRPGLLEQADRGILFLDEVHRLPPEGQEMLFSYIDHGSYRRLGEVNTTRSAQVMLICATTEDPSSALLKTFIRRIPMRINIPSLEERGIEERLGLISAFFTCESRELNNPILVSVNTMRALLSYTCNNNVGQLKSDIQLLCARAYSDFISHKKESISISSYGLPPYIRNGIFAEKARGKIWNIFAGINSRFIRFDAASRSPPPFGRNDAEDIYNIIESRTDEMRRIGASQEQIQEVISSLMTDYYSRYGERAADREITGIEGFVGAEIVVTVDKMLKIAARELGHEFTDNVRYGLSLHLSNTIRRVQKGLSITNPRLKNIQHEMPGILGAAQKTLGIIEEDFDIRLPPDEAGFIALFFAPKDSLSRQRPPVQVIVAAHGRGIATGLAETANRLLNTDMIRGFDVLFDESPLAAYKRIKEYLEQCSEIRDVLILVDMGSLVNYAYELEDELHIKTRCIPLVSTLHVLEAGRKALLGYSLYDIYEDTKQISNSLPARGNVPEQTDQKLYILTVCTTGEGSAQALKEYLGEKLDLKEGLCEILSFQFINNRDFNEQVEQLNTRGRIIGVVSALSTGISVPHFKLSSSMTSRGIKTIQECINGEAIFIEVGRNISNTLTSLQGERSIRKIRDAMGRIEGHLGIKLDSDMLIGIFCHISCMLDRLKHNGTIVEFPNKQLFLDKFSREAQFVRQECERLALFHGVSIPPDEICYILSLFMKEGLI